jgi:hypothetical protein
MTRFSFGEFEKIGAGFGWSLWGISDSGEASFLGGGPSLMLLLSFDVEVSPSGLLNLEGTDGAAPLPASTGVWL